MASFGLGMGGVDNSHDCILLIQPHHLAFDKHIHENYREFYTLKGNCIFNKTVVLKAKIFWNHIQCFWDDLGKVSKNFYLHHLNNAR